MKNNKITSFFYSFIACLSMFTTIPTFNIPWTKEVMSGMIYFFPVIGLIIGCILWCLYNLLFMLSSSIFVITPIVIGAYILLTGGIHLDGLIDTCDALGSHQSRERKIEILKDSHCGAFGIIGAILYFIFLYGGLISFITNNEKVLFFFLIMIISRTLGAMSMIILPKFNKKGTVAMFSRNIKKASLLYFVLIIIIIAIITTVHFGIFNLGLIGLLLLWYIYLLVKFLLNFGGINGDLCGFIISTVEVVACVLLGLL